MIGSGGVPVPAVVFPLRRAPTCADIGVRAGATLQMITAYVACLIFGGVLTLASFVTGGGDTDTDPSHTDGVLHHHGDGQVHTGLLPFLSLRFWIFAVTFFGLTGTGLSLLGGVSTGAVALFASGFGVSSGYVASRVLQALARAPVGLIGDAGSHVGREVKLLLPLSREQRSKVRLNIGGISTDLVAETESDQHLAAGTNVLVVGMRGTVALVESVPGAVTSKDPST